MSIEMDIITNIIKNYIAGGCKGDLHLSHSSITSLPEGLQVQRDLHLSYCSSLKYLPNNLKVGGSLVLDKSAICSLPKNLKVGKGLLLSGTSITKVSQLPLDLEAEVIISGYFDKSDFEDYRHKALQVNEKLSEDFDISALEDF